MDIAAYGWDHEAWRGTFYPDDLPVDWRLGFYANACRAVAVPAAAWTGLDLRGVAEWCDDVGEEFRFYLELPASGGADIHIAASFGGQLGGFLTVSDRGAAEALQAEFGHLAPVCRIEADGPAAGPGRLAVARCPPGRYEPRRLRSLIEGLAAAAAEGPAVLLFGGDPAAPQAMASARTLVELMGV